MFYESTITVNGLEYDVIVEFEVIEAERGERGEYGEQLTPDFDGDIEITSIESGGICVFCEMSDGEIEDLRIEIFEHLGEVEESDDTADLI